MAFLRDIFQSPVSLVSVYEVTEDGTTYQQFKVRMRRVVGSAIRKVKFQVSSFGGHYVINAPLKTRTAEKK